MANQYLALVEETTRGTNPGSGFKFLPVSGKIEPSTDFKDEPRVEFRGQDTALGNLTVMRQAKSYKYDLESYLYPIDIVGTLLKHTLGYAGTRTLTDTSGYQGIVYPPAAFTYGVGGSLVNKAITLLPNTDKDGTTVSQHFGGARPTGLKIEAKRPDDVKITFNLMGGPWIGTPGQSATAGASFTTYSPFNADDVACFAGAGITRTGTAPNYTAIVPNTMAQFYPDDLTITIENGLGDAERLNGLAGPSVTERTGQMKVTIEFSIDFSDPAAGLSSWDEWVALHSSPNTQNFLFVFTGPDLAGATLYHKWTIDIPKARFIGTPPERSADGKQPKMKMKYEHLIDSSIANIYPVAFLTLDKASAY